jgi:translation initiation factor 3 subunit D
MSDIKTSTLPLKETIFANVYAFNEFDSRAPGNGSAPEWRMKIDAQRGAVLGSEMKNNSCKLSRWTTESLLNGVDQMRFGFISRANPKDRKKHLIFGTSVYKPKDMENMIHLDICNGWGIFKAFVDICFGNPDGKYVLVKDPNNPLLRFYGANSSTVEDHVDVDDEKETFLNL